MKNAILDILSVIVREAEFIPKGLVEVILLQLVNEQVSFLLLLLLLLYTSYEYTLSNIICHCFQDIQASSYLSIQKSFDFRTIEYIVKVF